MKFNIVNILLIYDYLVFIADSMFNFLKFIQVLNMFKLLKMFIKFSMLSVFKILIVLKFMRMMSFWQCLAYSLPYVGISSAVSPHRKISLLYHVPQRFLSFLCSSQPTPAGNNHFASITKIPKDGATAGYHVCVVK